MLHERAPSIFEHMKLIDILINFSLECCAPVSIIDYLEFHEALFVAMPAKVLIIIIRAMYPYVVIHIHRLLFE